MQYLQQFRAKKIFIRPMVLNMLLENFTGAIPALPAENLAGKCRFYSKILPCQIVAGLAPSESGPEEAHEGCSTFRPRATPLNFAN